MASSGQIPCLTVRLPLSVREGVSEAEREEEEHRTEGWRGRGQAGMP
jgi:hypothetical protein